MPTTFTYTFGLTLPVGTSRANQIDSYILADVKKSLAERYALEHIALDSAETGATDYTNSNAQGRHIPGKVSCLLYCATYAEVLALVDPGVGAIAYVTETNSFYCYTSGGWQAILLSNEAIAPDNTSIIITGTSAGGISKIGLKRDYQQWTDMGIILDADILYTDCNRGNSFSIPIKGNRTLANPTNPHSGASYVWRIIQDFIGGRTLAFGDKFAFPGGVTPVLTTTPRAVDIIVAIYDGFNFNCSVMYDVKVPV